MPKIDDRDGDWGADRQHTHGPAWRAVPGSGDEGGADGREQGRGDIGLELVWFGSGDTLE